MSELLLLYLLLAPTQMRDSNCYHSRESRLLFLLQNIGSQEIKMFVIFMYLYFKCTESQSKTYILRVISSQLCHQKLLPRLPYYNEGSLSLPVLLTSLYHDFQSCIYLSSTLDCLPPRAHYKEHLAQRLALNI